MAQYALRVSSFNQNLSIAWNLVLLEGIPYEIPQRLVSNHLRIVLS